MIISTIRMAILPRKRQDALHTLQVTAQFARIQPGCMGVQIYEDIEDANVLMMTEMWRTSKDLNHHLGSEEYLNVLLVMEMSASAPMIRFDTISETAGFEVVEAARKGQ